MLMPMPMPLTDLMPTLNAPYADAPKGADADGGPWPKDSVTRMLNIKCLEEEAARLC